MQNIVLIIIGVFIWKRLNSKGMDEFITWIKKWEGKHSTDPKDTEAKYCAPNTKIHTSYGVTYRTFVGMSKKCGYVVSNRLFLSMPNEVWKCIFKQGYWNIWTGIDNLEKLKPSLAYYIAQVSWGSGSAGAERIIANFQRQKMGISDSNITKSEIINNFMLDPLPYKIRLKQLVEFRLENMKTMKTWNAHGKGWTNRNRDFLKQFG
jgi:lysozyme family protein